MAEIGYKLSSEEHTPRQMVEYAKRAEQVGFTFAMMADHFHPWIDKQGESAFVWSAIGAISQATERLRVGTGVTCPTVRIHPAIIAQAAATTAALMPGRFILGVGSGERLNEHIFGDHWPTAPTRIAMLSEAVELIRLLWKGEMEEFYGEYYTVENARIYTLPDELPPIYVAAEGPIAAEAAGKIGDGLISTSPNKEARDTFRANGGEGKPCYAELTVCWAESEAEARRTALERWPISGMKGELTQELAVPAHFEQAAKMVTEEAIAESVICGPDMDRHIEAFQKYVDAGYEHVWVHQIGDDQKGFFDQYEKSVLPELRRAGLIE